MIPVIDLASARSSVLRSLDDAYRTVGFAMVVGHGVPQAVIDDAFDASAVFHAMPLDRKLAIALDHNHRGYIPIASSTDRASSLEAATTPNQSESFMMMREDPIGSTEVASGTYLAGQNQWPDLPGFRDAVEAYHGALAEVAARVIDMFGELLGDHLHLSAAFTPPTTWLRLLHYPSVDAAAGRDVYGSAPHRDFGCLTLLAQDDVGGLQVRQANGGWIDVAPRRDAFVMNVGDMLHRWSNGRLISTPHRVINRSGRERFSIPFFFDPHMSAVIEPLPGCADGDQPSRFGPIEFGTFVRGQLEASYDRHRRSSSADG